MTPRRWVAAGLLSALVAVAGAGCTGTRDPDPPDSSPPGTSAPDATPPAGASPQAEPGETVTVALAGRPFQLHVPVSYDPATPAPLVLLLHGYTSTALAQEAYFQLTAESDARGFLYAMVDGSVDPRGDQFWNATEACCDFHDTGVDDSAYLRDLIDLLIGSYPVDPERIFLVGHSNGGFMAHAMACEHADVIDGIVSLAGMATGEAARCTPERPVSVLQIHGTADRVIPYEGGAVFGREFPSVEATLAMWREHNGCAGLVDDSAAPLDLDANQPGAETVVSTYAEGCREGSRVELWTIPEGGHVPPLTEDFAPAIMDFLYERA